MLHNFMFIFFLLQNCLVLEVNSTNATLAPFPFIPCVMYATRAKVLVFRLATFVLVSVVRGQEEVTEHKYNIVFSRDPVPSGLSEEQYYPMRLSNGSAYLCVLPDITVEEKKTLQAEDSELDVPLSLEHVAVVNRALKNMCYTMEESWWTYRLCWGSGVEQFHRSAVAGDSKSNAPKQMKEDPHFVLGVAPPADVLDLRYGVNTKGLRYIYTIYSDGLTCDLTQLPRTTEVQLYCAREGEGNSPTMRVREAEVCRYIVSLTAKEVCLLGLKEIQQRYGVITCHETKPTNTVDWNNKQQG
ncbi:hypothetical protein, conserved [Trypanosoma brucei gambiense DAL972]|uniref:MRH domain-containing protein n=1 Tax=Trypanosoma brucei gambiense (strain MHOM/CI/86/DAL972) TaxID=679716 RepID=D0A8S9_TRYB9|nr:hypothetical protein, conserved [Trypanosoma brucei gambiense DAL972]CBH18080.1 hypothetical protein, conserved [Trypanosoma brucei gambiense DAL972]|eukprot:XP_011780344.1 hypothetical protein, conserved [Trypanosoma brucei gambiense DAL972]